MWMAITIFMVIIAAFMYAILAAVSEDEDDN